MTANSPIIVTPSKSSTEIRRGWWVISDTVALDKEVRTGLNEDDAASDPGDCGFEDHVGRPYLSLELAAVVSCPDCRLDDFGDNQ